MIRHACRDEAHNCVKSANVMRGKWKYLVVEQRKILYLWTKRHVSRCSSETDLPLPTSRSTLISAACCLVSDRFKPHCWWTRYATESGLDSDLAVAKEYNAHLHLIPKVSITQIKIPCPPPTSKCWRPLVWKQNARGTST